MSACTSRPASRRDRPIRAESGSALQRDAESIRTVTAVRRGKRISTTWGCSPSDCHSWPKSGSRSAATPAPGLCDDSFHAVPGSEPTSRLLLTSDTSSGPPSLRYVTPGTLMVGGRDVLIVGWRWWRSLTPPTDHAVRSLEAREQVFKFHGCFPARMRIHAVCLCATRTDDDDDDDDGSNHHQLATLAGRSLPHAHAQACRPIRSGQRFEADGAATGVRQRLTFSSASDHHEPCPQHMTLATLCTAVVDWASHERGGVGRREFGMLETGFQSSPPGTKRWCVQTSARATGIGSFLVVVPAMLRFFCS